MNEQVFSPETFEALVLYIADKTRDDLSFGRVKLAKVLYYSDFEAYNRTGRPITGTTYERRKHGPFPRALVTAELDLIEGKGLAEHVPGVEGETRLVPTAIYKPVRPEVEDWQLVLIDRWIKEIQPLTANEISDQTHKDPGWVLAATDRRAIPFESVFFSREEPPDEAVERGERLAREFEWR